ncbi:MAG: ATP-dependent Clp protease adaptor ClpS [Bradyrhizobium sp.]|uniref:ATP-dependent Clp protease adaptor ClpS n=1 Tax=Bradyrhizobium sp. TaxID=376 RepID=UPI001D68A4E3|nr:ATP-dependent Clp protease adaptor ClpS [Bradyrhizobium sp.]MBV9564804.1 ATP-dependent Clp protease adaptor ClpS [Bradyrhizobium sp.]
MHDVLADAASFRIVFHNDDDTPATFVEDLLQNVFGLSRRDAIALIVRISQDERPACGPYPAAVTKALLDEALRRVRAAGHPFVITSEAVSGTPSEPQETQFEYACEALYWHFTGLLRGGLVTTMRQFPGHMRADLQVAIDRLFAEPVRFFGIHEEHRYETLSFAQLARDGRHAQAIAPPQYYEIDTGESEPVSCLQNGLWLCRAGELRFAVVLCYHREYSQEAGLRIEIAAPAGAEGKALAQRAFAELERAVDAARSYRGKILSFDAAASYRGRSRGVMVHRMPPVAREDVILPERTLKLLDRNVLRFIEGRDNLRRLGLSTRKGILLYGPPGTGKTHTIRYLATSLPGHTTLIITAAQVAYLGAYMNLARLLQPAMVVIEDVDLIARDRDEMDGPCEESLLNHLLNEMDGLKEDADILFVLTTNRPEDLEQALAGRPGRIDQAIEVPLPDEAGRARLVRLYGKGLPLDQAVVDEAARRTQGVSAAFIKELVRRMAQSAMSRDRELIEMADVDEALDDMLFAGGRLNVKLLGGAAERASA